MVSVFYLKGNPMIGWMRQHWGQALGVVAMLVLIGLMVAAPPSSYHSSPTSAEQEMMSHLRPATEAEQKQVRIDQEISNSAAGNIIMVATADIKTVRLFQPMTIVLPKGLHWLGGELGYISLYAMGSRPEDGNVFYDPACRMALAAVATMQACIDPSTRRSATHEEMMQHLIKVTPDNVKKLLSRLVVDWEVIDDNLRSGADFLRNWYVTFGDIRLSSSDEYLIFVRPGDRVVGGQLGKNQLVGTGKYGEGIFNWFCTPFAKDISPEEIAQLAPCH